MAARTTFVVVSTALICTGSLVDGACTTCRLGLILTERMQQLAFRITLLVLCMIALVGCSAGQSASQANTAQESQQPTFAVITPVGDGTPEPTLEQILTSLKPRKSVTVEEIHYTIQQLARRYPGTGDPIAEPSEELRAYLSALVGKRADAWHGWVTEYAPMDDAETSYYLSISMTEPTPGNVPYSMVTLTEVPRNQVQQLSNWGNPIMTGPWQEVVFDGRIDLVTPWGKIYVTCLSLQLDGP